MTPLLDNIIAFRKYVSANVNTDFETLEPHVDQALSVNIQTPWLGKPIVDDMANNINSNDSFYQEAIPLLQQSLSMFTFVQALPFIEVNISDSGLTRNETETTRTAYRGQVIRLEESALSAANTALSDLLSLLESNKSTYPLWLSAPGYVMYSRHFFRKADDFSSFVNVIYPSVTFRYLRPSMEYVELFNIVPEIGKSLFDDLRTKYHAANLSAKENEAVRLLQYAIANLSVFNNLKTGLGKVSPNGYFIQQSKTEISDSSLPSENVLSASMTDYQIKGITFLNSLISFLNSNIDDFPVYRDDASIQKQNSEAITGNIGNSYSTL